MTWPHVFSRAWRPLHVFALNSDWFIALFTCVVVSHSNNFGLVYDTELKTALFTSVLYTPKNNAKVFEFSSQAANAYETFNLKQSHPGKTWSINSGRATLASGFLKDPSHPLCFARLEDDMRFLQCEFKSFYILPNIAHSGLNSPSTRSQTISGFIYWIIL